MATIPVPRSYSQILSEAIGSTLSKLGLPSLRKGNPVLSILEAASRSDARQAQDIFNFLNSISLDRATGQALDRIGADEDTDRIPETPSSGPVTVTDTSFTKVQSRIFQGKPAPNVGSAVIYVQDATLFAASGNLYIGRGTTNLEGPLTYTSKVNNGAYWTINLSTPTQKYHNIGETVVFAQGGNRTISAGTLVQTSQGNSSTSIQYSTIFSAVIPDGETQITNVQVVCKASGTSGNTIAGGINAFVSPPFAGAAVTNPLPFSNGLATEDDETYRERLRQVRQSRSRGTPLAIKVNVTGITAVDENRRILSTSVLTRQGYPTTVYIDDGTGYEAKDTGVSYETVVDQALGGEQYMQLVQGRPVAKAYAKTELEAPYALEAGMVLSVKVGGALTEHSFSSTEFRNIATASAYEVVASINSNSVLGWQARTSDNGTKVILFAKNDTNEDIEVVVPADATVDSNEVLGFPLGRNDTLRLYKNDRLLNKDGTLAAITSNPQGSWGLMVSGETLIASVDGISLGTITFTDQDFVDAGTGYATLSASNTLEAWASVINFKVPGVTATVTGGVLVLTSNLGRNNRAKLTIASGSTLVSKGMFTAGTALGAGADYTFDRNLGQIRIEDSLVAVEGDVFTAGSIATRAFLESTDFNSIVFNNTVTSVAGQNGAEMWFFVDGDTTVQKVGIAGVNLTFSSVNIPSWGDRVTITAPSSIFTNVLAGDWIIVTDTSLPAGNRGAWQVVTATPTAVSFERPVSTNTNGVFAVASGGIVFARSKSIAQRIYLPYNTGAVYTATSLVSVFNSQLVGATASVYRTNQIRIRTNEFAIAGDIALVATNTDGARLGFPITDATSNESSHLAAQEAGHDEGGTPQFFNYLTTSTPTTTNIIVNTGGFEPDDIVEVVRPLSPAGDPRYGNYGFQTAIEVLQTASDLLLRNPPVKEWPGANRVYASRPYDFSPRDELAVLVDGDNTSKRFVEPFYRNLTPSTSTYGLVNTFKDKDNGDLSLAKVFGVGMDWKDFAVHMKSRGKSHRISGVDSNKCILWKYYRVGPEGNAARIKYVYPTAASQTVLASIDNGSVFSTVNVRLASGVARSGYVVRNSTYVGLATPTAAASALYTKVYVLNLPIASASRSVLLDFNSQTSNFTIGETITGVTSGATGVVASQVDSGATGTLTLTGGNNQPFLPGEFINGTLAGLNAAKATAAQYGGVSTLTLTNPASVTDHGLQVGDRVYVTSNDSGFTTGQKLISARTATTISYVETNTTASATNIGTVSKDTDGEAKFTPSTIIAGDLFKWSNPNFGDTFTPTTKVATISAGTLTGSTPLTVNPGIVTTLQWVLLTDTSYFSAFPLNAASNAITAIATTINAQANSPVAAKAVGTIGGDTSGVISDATFELTPGGLNTTAPVGSDGISVGYPLYDGINWVRSHTTPVTDSTHFVFTFKQSVEPSLATNNDWLNDDIRIVPMTTKNVISWLNTSGPGGLFANSEILGVRQGRRPQIATLLVGSDGSIQVQGGSANELIAVSQGSALAVGSTEMGMNLTVADANGLSARQWVRIQNNLTVAKSRITSSTALTSISGQTFTLSGTTAWDWATTTPGAIKDRTWQIEKQGDFVCFTYVTGGTPSLAGVQEGDVVHVSATALSPSLTATVNVRNRGFYRIVRVDTTNNVFWIENPNVAEETSIAHLAFLKYDSILPGDFLVINSAIWGSANVGTWSVAGLSLETLTGAANNTSVFTVTGSPTAQGAVAALDSNAGLIRVDEASPSRLYKKIFAIEPNATDSTLTFVKFTTQQGYEKVSENAGSYVEALDKLGFDNSIAKGVDGYRYHTGLIGEANKVAYGLENDPQNYPGVVAAGARVNIEGPIVRRVQIGLAIRVRTGVGLTEIQNQVRSAVAAAINNTAVGTHIAISDLIDAAGSVNGVVSVAVTSPSFAAGTDLINVQPYEKPLVLSLDDDILVSFIGD